MTMHLRHIWLHSSAEHIILYGSNTIIDRPVTWYDDYMVMTLDTLIIFVTTTGTHNLTMIIFHDKGLMMNHTATLDTKS